MFILACNHTTLTLLGASSSQKVLPPIRAELSDVDLLEVALDVEESELCNFFFSSLIILFFFFIWVKWKLN